MDAPAGCFQPVSPSHDLRQIGILAAVKGAFLERGLDGASMQDLARAAGMSAGNFYRYFPSKAALIEALVAAELARLEEEFCAVLQTGNLMVALRRGVEARLQDPDGGCPIWDDIEAAATRSPEIAAIVGRFEATILRFLVEQFARLSGLSAPEAESRFAAHALLLLILFKDIMANCSAHRPLARRGPALQAQLQELIFLRIESIFEEVGRYKFQGPAGLSGVEA